MGGGGGGGRGARALHRRSSGPTAQSFGEIGECCVAAAGAVQQHCVEFTRVADRKLQTERSICELDGANGRPRRRCRQRRRRRRYRISVLDGGRGSEASVYGVGVRIGNIHHSRREHSRRLSCMVGGVCSGVLMAEPQIRAKLDWRRCSLEGNVFERS